MIRVENVWHSYDGTTYVLKGVSLEVRAGELVCIMGPNGSGKTTLVRIISGLLKPTRGRVFINNVDVNQDTKEAGKLKIGVVFQNPDHQMFSETVEKEILFSLKAVGIKEGDARRRMVEALRRLGIEGLRGRNPLMLSGGEKKLVNLAAIIAIDPEIIIMDEPTAGQDWLNKKIIDEVVREAVSGGRSVIIVTHDVEFCAELDARVIILHDGEIITDGEA
ncbi:MAG: ABC transporter ATP-binding protein, partial [Candidatus Jordarchaeales archaeon]